MTIVDILNSYDEVKDDLEFQNISSVRTKIMLSLSEGAKKTKELQEAIGTPSSIILHGINELEKENLVSSRGDYHFLSKIGKEKASRLIDMVRTSISLKKFHKLWLNHEIDTIPHELLMEIGDLSNSQLIEANYGDMLKTHGIHTQIVLNAKKIKGVSPIFYPDYIETFNKVMKRGVKVELILTDVVLRKTLELHDSEGLKNFKRLISRNQLKIWKIKEGVKVAFTVTDKFITFGLFSKKGEYDSVKLLVSDHEDAIKWSNKLFDYYLKRAQKVNLEDLKNC